MRNDVFSCSNLAWAVAIPRCLPGIRRKDFLLKAWTRVVMLISCGLPPLRSRSSSSSRRSQRLWFVVSLVTFCSMAKDRLTKSGQNYSEKIYCKLVQGSEKQFLDRKGNRFRLSSKNCWKWNKMHFISEKCIPVILFENFLSLLNFAQYSYN